MGADLLLDAGSAGKTFDDPGRGVAVKPGGRFPIQQDRAVAAFPNAQVDRTGGAWSEGDGDDLSAFPGDRQGAMSSLHCQVFDVGSEGFRDPQPVEGQETGQGVFAAAGEAGLNQEHSKFVAVETDRVRFIGTFGLRTCTAGEWAINASSTQYR